MYLLAQVKLVRTRVVSSPLFISVFQNKIPEIPLQDQVRNYKMLV